MIVNVDPCACCGARDVNWRSDGGAFCSYCRSPRVDVGAKASDLIEITTIDSCTREYVRAGWNAYGYR